MIRALFWDHDGVLVDTEGLFFQATREVLAKVGVDLTEPMYVRYFLAGSNGTLRLGREHGLDEDRIRSLRRERDALYTELITSRDVLMPGIAQRLETLARRFRMAIVTGSRREHFAAIHRESGLLRHFEFALAREDYGESKPSPEPYLAALARIGLAADECLVIEDSERGALAARAAGLRCWALPSPLTHALPLSGVERRFASADELERALLALH